MSSAVFRKLPNPKELHVSDESGRDEIYGPYDLKVGSGASNYDVAEDGRFVMIRTPDSPTQESSSPAQEIHVVLNWSQELLERVPVP